MAKIPEQVKEKIKDVDLVSFTRDAYKEYGISVLEDRAFPDARDGMAPVHRRLLWATYKMGVHSKAKPVKSARIVGETLGKFHPHSDTSCYDALVKMSQSRVPIALFHGEGNWGSLSEKGAAAMRYTETRLSAFTDEIIFNKFYTPVVDLVPNYDGSEEEPLILPALLPIALLNGRFGIAPGAVMNSPIVTFKSLCSVLKEAYEGNELTAEFLFKTLRFRSVYGGLEVPPKGSDALASRKMVFKTPVGKVVIRSHVDYDDEKRLAIVTKFARDTEIPKLLESILALKGVSKASDASSMTDRYGRIEVIFDKGLRFAEYEKIKKSLEDLLSSTENYTLNFTERYVDADGQGKASVTPLSITDLLNKWVGWRISLEKRACAYWIAQDVKEIRRLDLLIQAVSLIDFIVSLLKNSKLSTDEVYSAYSKKCKCSVDEAKYVLSRPIISLRKLDQKELEAKKKEVEKNKHSLELRMKKPRPFLLSQLQGWKDLVT